MPVRSNMADEETKDVEMEEEEEDDSEDDSDEGESDEESGDSDKELQIAFEKGLLKPGLFQEVEKTKKEHVNNVEGLKAALNNLTTKNKFDWAERLDVTTQPVPDATGATTTAEEQPTEKNASKEETVHNDFQREMAISSAGASWLARLWLSYASWASRRNDRTTSLRRWSKTTLTCAGSERRSSPNSNPWNSAKRCAS